MLRGPGCLAIARQAMMDPAFQQTPDRALLCKEGARLSVDAVLRHARRSNVEMVMLGLPCRLLSKLLGIGQRIFIDVATKIEDG